MSLQSPKPSDVANSLLRSLPSVDKLLAHPELVDLATQFPRSFVVEEVRRKLAEVRLSVQRDNGSTIKTTTDSIVAAIIEAAHERTAPSPRRVINATGVILHTNLGRAALSDNAARAAQLAALSYSDLEYDIETGTRGSRHSHVKSLLKTVSGAESGIAANNNAAAALLTLSALAGDRGEVIVSRSEAVEIGGGFRVPDVMAQSGAKLVDVGTTNRTYARDYEAAIGPKTRAILKVHRSNFAISGFVHEDPLAEIVEIGDRHDIPIVHDLGSGCLIDTLQFGVDHEPTVQESVDAGAHLTLFSGDKLLGGPQAGIIVGKADLVDRVSAHPLARAVRIDKMTLAALNSTLRSYVQGSALDDLPILRMMAATVDDLRAVAKSWAQDIEAEIVGGRTAIGGGSAPGQTLPTKRLKIAIDDSADSIASRLRNGETPIIGKIEDDRFFLDPRTVLPEERADVAAALSALAD